MTTIITESGKDMLQSKATHSISVGEMYQPSKEKRDTTVRVDGTDIVLSENLWEDTDGKFDTDNKWCLTTYLEVPEACGTKEEVFTAAIDNVKILKAVGFLDYELAGMQEDGCAIWDRPAPDCE
jgi:hypothetical protein